MKNTNIIKAELSDFMEIAKLIKDGWNTAYKGYTKMIIWCLIGNIQGANFYKKMRWYKNKRKKLYIRWNRKKRRRIYV